MSESPKKSNGDDVEMGKVIPLALKVNREVEESDEEPLKSSAELPMCTEAPSEAISLGVLLEIVKFMVYLVAM